MATSVYDWMLAERRVPPAREEGATSGTEDILVRILKSLDQAASRRVADCPRVSRSLLCLIDSGWGDINP